MKLLIHSLKFRDGYIIYPTHYKGCNYLSMLGLKLNHVSKRGHRTKYWGFIRVPVLVNTACFYNIIRVVYLLFIGQTSLSKQYDAGISLGIGSTNERRRYIDTLSSHWLSPYPDRSRRLYPTQEAHNLTSPTNLIFSAMGYPILIR